MSVKSFQFFAVLMKAFYLNKYYISLQSLKNKSRRGKKGVMSMLKDHEADGPQNEELKALEAHMLSISKQGKTNIDYVIITIVV